MISLLDPTVQNERCLSSPFVEVLASQTLRSVRYELGSVVLVGELRLRRRDGEWRFSRCRRHGKTYFTERRHNFSPSAILRHLVWHHEQLSRDFIAPCKCKGTAKYVHRECLDHWRAVKEGFAFAHCTTCKAPYHLRVHVIADRRWRTLKFRFFVTRDILFIFLAVQLVGALLFFALLGLSGCFITCYDRRVRNDLAQPCRELCLCCCHPGLCADCHLPGTLCMWTDCTTCFEGCAGAASECSGCLGGAGEAGLPLLFIMALIVLGLFTVIGIFYSVLVATMVGQRIWQRHYHILAKRMLTKEYVVEDVDGEMTGSDWSPPPLPPEHVQQLKSLGLL
nr:RING/FYVE/PHD zinc finger superfamily protein [Ipomoea batatas]